MTKNQAKNLVPNGNFPSYLSIYILIFFSIWLQCGKYKYRQTRYLSTYRKHTNLIFEYPVFKIDNFIVQCIQKMQTFQLYEMYYEIERKRISIRLYITNNKCVHESE